MKSIVMLLALSLTGLQAAGAAETTAARPHPHHRNHIVGYSYTCYVSDERGGSFYGRGFDRSPAQSKADAWERAIGACEASGGVSCTVTKCSFMQLTN